eukprot:10468655-Alexandrium_andersonii.AAC.1
MLRERPNPLGLALPRSAGSVGPPRPTSPSPGEGGRGAGQHGGRGTRAEPTMPRNAEAPLSAALSAAQPGWARMHDTENTQ